MDGENSAFTARTLGTSRGISEKFTSSSTIMETITTASTDYQLEEIRRKVFIGGIPKAVKIYEFLNYFSKFGAIKDKASLMKKRTFLRRGFVILEFEEIESVEEVLSFKPHLVGGQEIFCRQATPKPLNSSNGDNCGKEQKEGSVTNKEGSSTSESKNEKNSTLDNLLDGKKENKHTNRETIQFNDFSLFYRSKSLIKEQKVLFNASEMRHSHLEFVTKGTIDIIREFRDTIEGLNLELNMSKPQPWLERKIY